MAVNDFTKEAENMKVDNRKKESNKSLGQPLAKKLYLEDNDSYDKEKSNEIIMTEEDERKIKEVVSDLNEKAFYGKIMKKSKNLDKNGDF